MFSFDEIFSSSQAIQQHKIPKSYRIGNRDIKEEKLLSEGAYGYIWRATDIRTGEVFALKRVICTNAERLATARNELQVMKKLKPCANLVGFYGGDIIRQGNSKSVVVTLMEMCPNGTLFDQLEQKQDTGFKQQQLLRIMQAMCNGISSLHSIGYAHRDIKIQNVLLGKDNNYKLCDFGSCTNKITDFSTINQSDFALYEDDLEKNTTPMYRPPEIADPFLRYRVSEKVDVWMLGCVLYTLCYFIHPFLEANKLAISRAVYKIPMDGKYRYSNKINDLIRHMLTPNPQNRPSINDILTIIKNWKQISEIPLNAEARALKKEQENNAKEFEKFNKKVIDHDGDIPIEELMKLQKKIETKISEPVTSFAKPKTVAKTLSYVPPTNRPAEKPNNDFLTFGEQTTSKPIVNKANSTGHDLWDQLNRTESQKSQQKETVNFDFFTNGFNQDTNKTSKPVNSDFDFFGTSTQKPQPPKPPQNDFNFF